MLPSQMAAWRKVVEQVVGGIADADLQRRAWFGIGPEESSPDEEFNQFFDDAAVEEFLARPDTGLSRAQLQAGQYLLELMKKLSTQTPQYIEPSSLIDDPRWQEIREAAAQFLNRLSQP